MYRFREVDVSGIGPFGKCNPIHFGDGVTLICAENGLGKTTISRALRRVFSDVSITCDGRLNPLIPNWLIYFDDELHDLPMGGRPWEPFADFVATGVLPNLDWHQLADDITLGVSVMLSNKIESRYTKFSGAISSSQSLTVAIQKNGQIDVVDEESGGDVNWGFLAAGEKFVLFLAVNSAIRKQGGSEFDVPIVVDSWLVMLDEMLLEAVSNFIENMSSQVIFLQNGSLNDRLRRSPNYELRCAHDSGKSEIVTCP